MALVLPRLLSEPVSLQQLDSAHLWGPFRSRESVGLPATFCCCPPAPHPQEARRPPDHRVLPRLSLDPAQSSSDSPPTFCLGLRRGEFPPGSKKAASASLHLFVVLSPLFFHSFKNSPPPPHTTSPTYMEHFVKGNALLGPGPAAGIPKPGFLGEGGAEGLGPPEGYGGATGNASPPMVCVRHAQRVLPL